MDTLDTLVTICSYLTPGELINLLRTSKEMYNRRDILFELLFRSLPAYNKVYNIPSLRGYKVCYILSAYNSLNRVLFERWAGTTIQVTYSYRYRVLPHEITTIVNGMMFTLNNYWHPFDGGTSIHLLFTINRSMRLGQNEVDIYRRINDRTRPGILNFVPKSIDVTVYESVGRIKGVRFRCKRYQIISSEERASSFM